MPLMPCNNQTWSELHTAINLRSLSAGVRIIRGPSAQMAGEIQTLLHDLDGVSVEYFLCSGDSCFQLPCYNTFLDTSSATVEPLNAFHVMDYWGLSARDRRDVYTPWYALDKLERTIENGKNTFQLVILEFLTPPTSADINFIKQIFLSPLARHVPVIVMIHQQNEVAVPYVSSIMDHLALLYMAGGRIRATEWSQLTSDVLSLAPLGTEESLATRRIGASMWITYRNSTIATLAKNTFHALNLAQKRLYAKKLLQILPPGTTYPLLSIASYLDDFSPILSCYTSSAIKAALVQPRTVLNYFRKLRRSLKHGGDPVLLEAATVNTICALLCCYPDASTRLYRLVQRDEAYFVSNAVKTRVVFALGQVLVQSKDQRLLQIAAKCFQQCRTLLDTDEKGNSPENISHLAAIRNGEALIALKQGRYESALQALQLETVALTELQQVAVDGNERLVAQQALLLTHIGDIHRRMLGNREKALHYYQEAAAFAQKTSSFMARTYVFPRLSDVLLLINRDIEAANVLDVLWRSFTSLQKVNTPTNRSVRLKTGLTLAQVYMKRGMPRKAAVYYWSLLRESAWLKPAAVRGIIANLRHCRPKMSTRLWKYTLRIVALQEGAMRDVANIERYFDGISAGEIFSLGLIDGFVSALEEERV